ncbi:hypothetical protein SAMN05720606_106237 [Paenibacillus polysaccharolyticus]|uniref:Uncharacterized protein n=1 Tax=Paenibacillus polysaccharolyticus TaxID=582692 RepID=A0A1G5H8H8_9BACL|nr:hypothetical protein SAMN05720606_106237 [Paenibacillus polysaccharolyticus]
MSMRGMKHKGYEHKNKGRSDPMDGLCPYFVQEKFLDECSVYGDEDAGASTDKIQVMCRSRL